MVIRHIILAGLVTGAVAGTSIAQATPVSTVDGVVVAGWTLEKGSVNVVGALDYLQVVLAAANADASYDLHSTLAGKDGNSAKLYTVKTGTAAARYSYNEVPTQMLLPAGKPLTAMPATQLASGGGAAKAPALNSPAGSAGTTSGSSGNSGDTASSAGPASTTSTTTAASSPALTQQLVNQLLVNDSPLKVDVIIQADAVNDVPEPGSNLLILAGLMAGAVVVRRRSV